MKAAERAAMLTQQLLAFSRRQMVAFRHVSLNEVVQRHAADARADHRRGRAAARRPGAATCPAVYFDPGQLQQVILNLAVNAREAMPQGGTLTLDHPGGVQAAPPRRASPS